MRLKLTSEVSETRLWYAEKKLRQKKKTLDMELKKLSTLSKKFEQKIKKLEDRRLEKEKRNIIPKKTKSKSKGEYVAKKWNAAKTLLHEFEKERKARK